MSLYPSSGATVKAVTASQVEYMLLNHSNEGETTDFPHETKSTRQTCHSLKPHNNKQTREKSQVVMKGIQLPVVSNNATTGHKSRQQR
jgi:hypothetical protein